MDIRNIILTDNAQKVLKAAYSLYLSREGTNHNNRGYIFDTDLPQISRNDFISAANEICKNNLATRYRNAFMLNTNAILYAKLYAENDFKNPQNAISNTINGNNNVVNNYGNISNSFNTDSLNNFIEELKNSDEDKELVKIIVEAYEKDRQLLIDTINNLKSSSNKDSKIELVKNFLLKLGKTATESITTTLLNILLTRT